MDEQARMKILEMIEAGTISAEEGLRLLQTTSPDSQDVGEDDLTSQKDKINVQTDQPGENILEFSFPDSSSKDATSQDALDSEKKSAPVEDGSGPGFESESETTEEPDSTYSEKYGSTFSEGFSDTSFEPLPADVEKWRRWWMVPLWVGVAVTVLAGIWMYSSFINQGFSFWFACSWFPFMLGVGMMALSYASRRSRWLHVRIQQKPGDRPQNIAISMPLPLGLATWFFRYFGHFIPDLPDIQIEEILKAVSESTGPQNPLYIEVDEGSGGEKVKIYIG